MGLKGDGTFREKEVKLAKALGSWMDVNSSAIYNTRYAGWEKQDWGYYTKIKDSNTVNMIVFNIPISKALRVNPAKNILIDKASFLGGSSNKPLKIETLDNGEFFIHLPEDYNAKEPFVIELESRSGKTENKEIKAKT